jgi:hypothetical protein
MSERVTRCWKIRRRRKYLDVDCGGLSVFVEECCGIQVYPVCSTRVLEEQEEIPLH